MIGMIKFESFFPLCSKDSDFSQDVLFNICLSKSPARAKNRSCSHGFKTLDPSAPVKDKRDCYLQSDTQRKYPRNPYSRYLHPRQSTQLDQESRASDVAVSASASYNVFLSVGNKSMNV